MIMIISSLTPETKMKALRAYFEPTFLCNGKIWTITTSQVIKNHLCIPAETLESLCTKRKMANTVKNEDVYRKTAATEWRKIIQKRILKWFGKVIRADESTPVTRPFNYTNSPYQRPRCKPTSTWLNIIISDFRNLNVT